MQMESIGINFGFTGKKFNDAGKIVVIQLDTVINFNRHSKGKRREI